MLIERSFVLRKQATLRTGRRHHQPRHRRPWCRRQTPGPRKVGLARDAEPAAQPCLRQPCLRKPLDFSPRCLPLRGVSVPVARVHLRVQVVQDHRLSALLIPARLRPDPVRVIGVEFRSCIYQHWQRSKKGPTRNNCRSATLIIITELRNVFDNINMLPSLSLDCWWWNGSSAYTSFT